MVVTDWKSPGTVVSDDLVGTVAWSNPSYAIDDDTNYAKVVGLVYEGKTTYLKATNFGFEIPTGAVIDGVEALVHHTSFGICDDEVKIVLANTAIGSTNKATGYSTGGAFESVVYGGSDDLWGESWTASDINSTNLGVVWSGLGFGLGGVGNGVSVDYIRMRVYYTETTTPTIGTKYPLPAFSVS